MSISASWLVLAVLLLRLFLKKTPKWVAVLLWGIVAVRLVCPFSIESVLSLIPSAETISPEIMLDATPEIHTGIQPLNSVINPVISQSFAPAPMTSANPLQILIPVAAVLWLAGIVVMLVYTAITYFLLLHRVNTAVRLKDNIYQSENVDSPFVLGIIKPKIYLPFRLDGQNLSHVIAHEQAHIRRKDHWWKPLGFVLLAIHWFNPVLWLGYILLCRDIELACDEKVIQKMDNTSKADYTEALVACSVRRRSIAACPLAFGEVGVKARVKSVMNYKKPTFWVIVAAVVICIAVAVCFLTDPVAKNEDLDPVEIKNPWVQPYTPGTDGIQGNVDVEKYTRISPDFAIGADRYGYAVFKDPNKAFQTFVTLYEKGISAIKKQYDLAPISGSNYALYKTYGWQTDTGSEEAREQALFVTQFLDIYENSFTTEIPEDGVAVVDTVQTNLKTYYELSDGTWRADGRNYKHRLEINGRMHNAAVDSTFVYLSNLETITFEQAWLAAGLSSNTKDYFSPEEAVLVDWITGEDTPINGAISGKNTFIVEETLLENALENAILDQNAPDRFPSRPTGPVYAEAHQLLGIQSSPTLEDEKEYKTELTVYVQYVYHQYTNSNGELSRVAANATPAVLSFVGGPATGYQLQDFKEPNGGNVYAEEVRKLFPAKIADILLDPQNDVIDMEKLESDCLEKAKHKSLAG